jgi:hypothetical protein
MANVQIHFPPHNNINVVHNQKPFDLRQLIRTVLSLLVSEHKGIEFAGPRSIKLRDRRSMNGVINREIQTTYHKMFPAGWWACLVLCRELLVIWREYYWTHTD